MAALSNIDLPARRFRILSSRVENSNLEKRSFAVKTMNRRVKSSMYCRGDIWWLKLITPSLVVVAVDSGDSSSALERTRGSLRSILEHLGISRAGPCF